MNIQSKEGKKNGEVGLALTCTLPSKYQSAKKKQRVKSSSCTLHVEKGVTPKQVIKKIKELLINEACI